LNIRNVIAPRPTKIAIAAMGGQGGGVLANWIVDLAETGGYLAQMTSVPGVAQRSGTTIYYIEIFPLSGVEGGAKEPVMALLPSPGDVDIVIASELVEAGRSVIRGIVTPDRTTLITSSHRDYAMDEKTAMGDARVDAQNVHESLREASKRLIQFDMAALAEKTDSIISSVLFGALARTQALPFTREAHEGTIRRSGVGVDASLRGFAAGYEGSPEESASPAPAAVAPRTPSPEVMALLKRVEERLPGPARSIITQGVRRLLDYQDPLYASEYLDRLEWMHVIDAGQGGANRGFKLTEEVARYLALWMTYEDTIRVADLKTRASRFARVRDEMRAGPDQIVYITEFMHPRVEEFCDTLPYALGSLVLRTPWLRRFVALFCSRRRVRTSSLGGFLLLYLISALKPWRRGTYRYRLERARIAEWLELIGQHAVEDYALAVEIAECQRLVKGYGETHERGLRNFQRIVGVLDAIRKAPDPAKCVRELRAAALADETGKTLSEMLPKAA
jgi:indolepyruvate ferredoxin oxidoreductase beta subunit